MTALYQKAIDFPFVNEKGEKKAKFVNLDMEEYKDTHFTLKLFKTTLPASTGNFMLWPTSGASSSNVTPC